MNGRQGCHVCVNTQSDSQIHRSSCRSLDSATSAVTSFVFSQVHGLVGVFLVCSRCVLVHVCVCVRVCVCVCGVSMYFAACVCHPYTHNSSVCAFSVNISVYTVCCFIGCAPGNVRKSRRDNPTQVCVHTLVCVFVFARVCAGCGMGS